MYTMLPPSNFVRNDVIENIQRQLEKNGWKDVFVDEYDQWWGFKDNQAIPQLIPEKDRKPFPYISEKANFVLKKEKMPNGDIKVSIRTGEEKHSWLKRLTKWLHLS